MSHLTTKRVQFACIPIEIKLLTKLYLPDEKEKSKGLLPHLAEAPGRQLLSVLLH